MADSNETLFVVGIGASAGGLNPIEEFFDHMPVDCGMAFVVVQHLSPDFKSLMDELLARHTKMAIHKVSDGVKIEPNSIYLIPPEKNMAMSEGTLLLSDKTAQRGLNLPIDIFFSSLAADAGERAIAIVLSGTGSDGSRGIRDVREAGGLVLVQSSESAGFDGMPRAAVGTGVVDLICTPKAMPQQLLSYTKHRDIRLPDATRVPLSPVLGSVIHEQTQPFVGNGSTVPTNQAWLTFAYEDLLSRHVPPSLLVNDLNELVHCFGDARNLLTPPEGKPTNNVLKMLDKDLSVSVSAAIHRAKAESIPVVYKEVRIKLDDDDLRLFQVTVEPYNKQGQSLFLISLEEMEKVVAEENFQASGQSNDRIEQLERELNYTRETLQATVEELESSNEELIASNEELQSTNEELHSVNEDLYTVNSEHKEKIEELTQLTSDMDNLFKSTEIGTIFLDKSFNIRMFTPSITAGFNVMDQDIGRPINHISYKLDSPHLLTDASNVLTSGVPREVEVYGRDRRIYLQRIQPYRVENRIEGVVLTLTDITALREAENTRLTMQTLSEISQELPDFAYAVSHDLQAPLRHISQYTEILETSMEKNNPDGMKKAAHVLRNSSLKLREKIDGLLAYSRINTLGKKLGPIDLKTPIDAAMLELGSSLEVNNAKVKIAEGMPKVLGDRNQLKLLFFHLIENAIKFRGEEDPHITISAAEVDGMIEVSVADNGIGIQEQHFEDVFTIFKRLGFKDGVPGAGVGLAICRRIAVRHHGRIWLQFVEEGTRICTSLRAPDLTPISSQLSQPRMTKNRSSLSDSQQEA